MRLPGYVALLPSRFELPLLSQWLVDLATLAPSQHGTLLNHAAAAAEGRAATGVDRVVNELPTGPPPPPPPAVRTVPRHRPARAREQGHVPPLRTDHSSVGS